MRRQNDADFFARIADRGTLRAGFIRVRDNHGCAGADGVTIDEFQSNLDVNVFALEEALVQNVYWPLPLLEILVDRGDGSARRLCVPAVRDRIAQAAALAVLSPIFEAEFERCSFGYRPGRSVRDAVLQIKAYFDQGYRWVVEADIDAFFDSVDHELLLTRVRRLISEERIVRLLELWVRAAVWDGSQVRRLKRGIPQGAVTSPALANLFLDDLDEALLAAGQRLVRYADDFVILCKDRRQAERAAKLTDEVLDSLALELDDAAITTFDAGFTFLGVTFMRSLILQPFDRPKREKRVLFMPAPMNPAQVTDWNREQGSRQ
jgi:group II intron reverse transcriptase/maturase